MSDSHSGVPNVKIIPPLVYLVGIVIGIVISIWIPTKIAPSSLAWTLGGILLICGAVLNGSAILKFKNVGTPVRPDRAANTLVVVGPYRITRNPMYLGLALVYVGIALADQSVWALILLPVVLTISVEQSNRRRRFWKDVLGPTTSGTKKTSGVGYNAFHTASAGCPLSARNGSGAPDR